MAKNTPAVIEPASTELAVTQADLPGLYEAVDQDARMVPSIYLMQGLSTMVQDGIAKPGDAVLALGTSDLDPVFLVGGPDKRESFTAFVIARRLSYARYTGGDMEWLTKVEFDAARAAGDRDAWTNFHYILAIPEIDAILPARILLTKTGGTKVARQVNTLLDRSIRAGSTDPIAVKFTVKEDVGRASGKKFHAFQVALVSGTPADLAAARTMQAYSVQMHTENDAPIVADDQPGF